MKITRKEFLNTAVGAAALAAIPMSGAMASSCMQGSTTGKPKRGVSIYSYSSLLHTVMTLEDCFKEIHGAGAHGLEILSSHVTNYPNPTDEWIEWWWSMMEKYELTPVEFGVWQDSRKYAGRELSTQESYDMMSRDLRIANKLGFTRTRTYIGVSKADRTPVQNWREFMEMLLPLAEELNIKMCVEIHMPTLLKSNFLLDEYLDFIEKTGTKWFGFNVDFGLFQTKIGPGPLPESREGLRLGMGMFEEGQEHSIPEDIIPFLPYTYCCHAKFQNVSDDIEDTTTPYPEIIDILLKNKWDGYLLSEYEGYNRDVPGYAASQVRKQHILLNRLLGA